MSVRRLSSLQKARRVLRERHQRCIMRRLSGVKGSLDRSGARLWSDSEIGTLVREAKRRGRAQFTKNRDGWQYEINARQRAHGIDVSGNDWNRFKPGMFYYLLANHDKCPCTPQEFVAIDTLLETGDRYAEHLAVKCRNGGSGVLEGEIPPVRRKRSQR